jgi:hypothetical protein
MTTPLQTDQTIPLGIEESRQIVDLETLKVISDPLRIRLLDAIGIANRAGKRRTVKQLAAELNIPHQKLYYHINLLEKHALIRVAETQVVSGIIEKHYQVQARSLSVARSLFERGVSRDQKAQAALALLDSALEATRNDMIQLVDRFGLDDEELAPLDGRRGHISRALAGLSPDQAAEFHGRLTALVNEFEALEAPVLDEEAIYYSLTTILLPTGREADDGIAVDMQDARD